MKLRGLEWPKSIPLCTLLPQLRSPCQITLLIKRTRCSSCLSPSSRFQIPARSQNYSNKPVISSHRTWRTPCFLDTTRPNSLSPWFFTLFWGTMPVWPGVTCIVLLAWAVSICDQQSAVSHIFPESGVVYLAIPMTLGQESPLPHEVTRRRLKHSLSPAMSDDHYVRLSREWNCCHSVIQSDL